jgi:hypothetical protein
MDDKEKIKKDLNDIFFKLHDILKQNSQVLNQKEFENILEAAHLLHNTAKTLN